MRHRFTPRLVQVRSDHVRAKAVHRRNEALERLLIRKREQSANELLLTSTRPWKDAQRPESTPFPLMQRVLSTTEPHSTSANVDAGGYHTHQLSFTRKRRERNHFGKAADISNPNVNSPGPRLGSHRTQLFVAGPLNGHWRGREHKETHFSGRPKRHSQRPQHWRKQSQPWSGMEIMLQFSCEICMEQGL